MIVLSADNIYTRFAEIRKILRPLSNTEIACNFYDARVGRGKVIAAYQGTKPEKYNYRDWYFKTVVSEFIGSYFELWEPNKSGTEWYLNRAYFTLFKKAGADKSPIEYVCVHCDPNEPDGAPHFNYKRGPHIHIKAAHDPIPRAHIALDLTNVNALINDIDLFNQSVERAMVLIKEEILEQVN